MTILAAAILFGGQPDDFVKVPSGTYTVGRDDQVWNPQRKVKVKAYEIAKYETTNAQFAEFVKATGYRTMAERNHNGMTFEPPLPEFKWIQDETADWRHPNGKSHEGIEDRQDHPVTGICQQDALAYCKWAKVRLPNLEEWEVAARAGTTDDYFFGPDGSHIGEYANVWHGRDHQSKDESDGYMTTSPVGKFKANPWGLYDVYGNVFELCSGRVEGDKPTTAHARGGSWWCSKNACCAYNSFFIGRVDSRASFSNLGFRVAR